MAVLRMAVREPRVCCHFILHRAARGQLTMTTTGGGNENVTWTWNNAVVAGPVGTCTGYGGSAATAMMTYPTWEEVRKVLGPDCRAIDWIHSRYRRARD